MKTLDPLIPAEAAGLGLPLGEYRRSWIPPLLTWGLLALAALAGLWLASRDAEMPWQMLAILAGVAALMAALAAIDTRSAWRGRIILFEQGVIDLFRRRSRVYRWDRASSLKLTASDYQGLTILEMRLRASGVPDLWLSTRYVTARPLGRPPANLPRLTAAELIQAIAAAANPVLISKALAAYDAGETVDCGVFKLSRAGIQAKSRLLPWSEVADIAQPQDSASSACCKRAGSGPGGLSTRPRSMISRCFTP